MPEIRSDLSRLSLKQRKPLPDQLSDLLLGFFFFFISRRNSMQTRANDRVSQIPQPDSERFWVNATVQRAGRRFAGVMFHIPHFGTPRALIKCQQCASWCRRHCKTEAKSARARAPWKDIGMISYAAWVQERDNLWLPRGDIGAAALVAMVVSEFPKIAQI